MVRAQKLWRGDGKTLVFGGKILENSVGLARAVEKGWKSLCGSLWESCGKVLHMACVGEFCTKMVAKVEVLHVVVEKFCRGIYTWLDRGRVGFCTVSTAPTITTINLLIRTGKGEL